MANSTVVAPDLAEAKSRAARRPRAVPRPISLRQQDAIPVNRPTGKSWLVLPPRSIRFRFARSFRIYRCSQTGFNDGCPASVVNDFILVSDVANIMRVSGRFIARGRFHDRNTPRQPGRCRLESTNTRRPDGEFHATTPCAHPLADHLLRVSLPAD